MYNLGYALVQRLSMNAPIDRIAVSCAYESLSSSPELELEAIRWP